MQSSGENKRNLSIRPSAFLAPLSCVTESVDVWLFNISVWRRTKVLEGRRDACPRRVAKVGSTHSRRTSSVFARPCRAVYRTSSDIFKLDIPAVSLPLPSSLIVVVHTPGSTHLRPEKNPIEMSASRFQPHQPNPATRPQNVGIRESDASVPESTRGHHC